MTVRGVPMIPPSTYADAEVRGRLRQWKADLSRSYRIVDRLLDEQGPPSSQTYRHSAFAGRYRAAAGLLQDRPDTNLCRRHTGGRSKRRQGADRRLVHPQAAGKRHL